MNWLRRGDSGLSLPLFALAHVAIFAALFRGIYSMPYSGTVLYYDYAGRTLSGLLPYRDFLLEYPPFALVFFTLPRVFGESFQAYFYFYQIQVILADLAVLAALWFAARHWNLSPWRVLAAYTIAVLVVGPITIHQFDIFPAAFSLFAVLAFARGRSIAASIWLALGVATKVYPILLAPMFALVEWRRGRLKSLVAAGVTFTLTCALTALPWLLRAPRSLLVMTSYHEDRGIQLESTWASVAFFGRMTNLTWVDTRYAFGSWQVEGPWPSALRPISTVVLIAILSASYWWVNRRIRDGGTIDVTFLARTSGFLLLASMASSKVFSPQYLFWPVPFLAFLDLERDRLLLGVFVALGVLTYWIYPHHYRALIDRQTLPIAALALRNALVIVMALLLARSIAVPAASPRAVA